jgi:16S rRNA (guanine1207-N2)-methyltransferase
MENLLTSAQGTFTLRRYPVDQPSNLRAWDAADEYLLSYLAEHPAPHSAHWLIANDGFGALSTALHCQHPTVISDSWIARQAAIHNLMANGLSVESVEWLTSLETPAKPVDVLLIKIPKTLALLEYQLHLLRPLLHADSIIIAAGMVKNMPKTVWPLLERLLGPTTTSLARKKARLIHVRFDTSLTVAENPYPSQYRLENSDLRIHNHANVFSRQKLDIGTRFLLQHLPVYSGRCDVIDLGCGNGVVGLVFAQQTPGAKIHFIDESYMALASARLNFEQLFSGTRQAEYIATDCLSAVAAQSADLIICNPPFHQQHTVGDYIARQMFRQAKKVLRPGGELRVIGNRHLHYHRLLKRLFGHCELIASNQKFVILQVKR